VSWAYELTATARQNLRDLGPSAETKVISYLKKRISSGAHPKLWADPYRGDLHGYWKIRIGEYRAIARLHEHVLRVEVVKVGNCRDVYE
jgi:mRNA interferase RelE/StbE